MPRISCPALIVVALLILSLSGLAMSQSSLSDDDRAEIVRAVLTAEQRRQRRTFEDVTHLSTERIASLNPERFAAALKLTLLTPSEINKRAKGFIGARYLVLEDFKIEGASAVVRLGMATKVTPCFGRFQKHRKEFTYRLEKTAGVWRAELVGHPLAYTVSGGLHQ